MTFALHAAGNAHYGFFRDELYFIVCGRHAQWGYVDQPPVVPLLAAATQMWGASLFLLRLVPAIFAAAAAYVTCVLASEFGGGAFAQVVAALAFLFAPVLLSFGGKVSTDEVGLLTWPLLALLAVRIVKTETPGLWLAFGAVAGVSIESKYSVLFFLIALFVGLASSPERGVLFSRWAAGGALVAAVLTLPNFLWQMHYGFPMWELLQAGAHGKNIIAGPLLYVVQEILITNLFLFAVWAIGLVWLLRTARYRFLGVAYVVLIVEMLALGGKHYYPAAVYPILMAAGGVQIERWTRHAHVARYAVAAWMVISGSVFVPFALPVLPEPQFLAYLSAMQNALHIRRETLATEHERDVSPLPGDYADMHGWPQLAATVQRLYDGLPPSDRAKAVVLASNYGEASAIAFFTPSVPVISGHNQFWLWGTRGFDGSVVIDVNGYCGRSRHLFDSVTLATRFNAPYTIGWETDIPIAICKGIRVPVAQIWPSLKSYE